MRILRLIDTYAVNPLLFLVIAFCWAVAMAWWTLIGWMISLGVIKPPRWDRISRLPL